MDRKRQRSVVKKEDESDTSDEDDPLAPLPDPAAAPPNAPPAPAAAPNMPAEPAPAAASSAAPAADAAVPSEVRRYEKYDIWHKALKEALRDKEELLKGLALYLPSGTSGFYHSPSDSSA